MPNVVSIGSAPSEPLNVLETLARDDPIVVLVELISQVGIGQEIGEIAEQIEGALDHVGVGFPRAHIIALGQTPREGESLGVATI